MGSGVPKANTIILKKFIGCELDCFSLPFAGFFFDNLAVALF